MADLERFSTMFANGTDIDLGDGLKFNTTSNFSDLNIKEELANKVIWYSEDAKNDPTMKKRVFTLKFITDDAWTKTVMDGIAEFANQAATTTANAVNTLLDATGIDPDGEVGEAIKKAGEAAKAKGKTISQKMQELVNKFKSENISSDAYDKILVLPIPNELSESDKQNYDDANVLGDDSTSEWIKDGFENDAKTLGELRNLGDAATQWKHQTGSTRNRKAAVVGQLPLLNPHLWQRWKGSDVKSFEFTISFVPRNKKEAQTMCQMIYLLKKYSYGSTGSPIYDHSIMIAPPKVLITFPNPILQKMLNPGICVLTSVTTKYNEGNIVGMTYDGVPRAMEVQLEIKEYMQRFRSDFEADKS